MKASQTALLLSVAQVWAAPAAQPSVDPVYGPPGASGDLRPSPDLVGYDPSNRVPTSPSTNIPADKFELAPGQSEDRDLGLFIDLSNVKNPQPVSDSTTGPTDPGPR